MKFLTTVQVAPQDQLSKVEYNGKLYNVSVLQRDGRTEDILIDPPEEVYVLAYEKHRKPWLGSADKSRRWLIERLLAAAEAVERSSVPDDPHHRRMIWTWREFHREQAQIHVDRFLASTGSDSARYADLRERATFAAELLWTKLLASMHIEGNSRASVAQAIELLFFLIEHLYRRLHEVRFQMHTDLGDVVAGILERNERVSDLLPYWCAIDIGEQIDLFRGVRADLSERLKSPAGQLLDAAIWQYWHTLDMDHLEAKIARVLPPHRGA